MTIYMQHSRVTFTPTGCVTAFRDGASIESWPHDTHHYHVIAHRCGYGDDILGYCREHDFAHLFLWESIYHEPSPVLWAVAHKIQRPDDHAAVEEIAATAFQRWLRANEEPIVGGVDWNELKARALKLVADA